MPTLRPGDIVVMDNLGARMRCRPRRDPCCGCEASSCRPTHPIEQVFAKLKHFLRKAQACTAEATWRHIGSLIDRFSPFECASYFRNAGYASV